MVKLSKSKTIWSLIIVVFILLLVGIFYYFNKDSFALFSDEIEGKRVIEVSVSNEGTCKNLFFVNLSNNSFLVVSFLKL